MRPVLTEANGMAKASKLSFWGRYRASLKAHSEDHAAMLDRLAAEAAENKSKMAEMANKIDRLTELVIARQSGALR